MALHNLEEYSRETNDSVEFASGLLDGVRLPPQPTIVVAISKELANDSPDFRKIGDLLEQDPAMVSRVLKVINSPLFGVRREVTSIRTALSLLGIKNFYSMIVTSAAQESLGFKGCEMEQLWAHSLHVAKVCQEIASKVKDVSPEEAYLVGLFHDGAVPLLVTKFREYKEIIERVVVLGGDIASIEEQRFNVHHAVIGAVLAKSWGLPPYIYKVIRFHHGGTLKLLSDPKARKLGATLMLGDHLARCVFSEGHTEDCQTERWLNLLQEIRDELGVDNEQLNSFHEVAIDLADTLEQAA